MSPVRSPPAIRALPEKPDIRLVIPLYPARGSATEYKLQPVVAYDIPHKDGPIKARAFETKLGDLPVYFIGGAPLVVDWADLFRRHAGRRA